MPPVERRIALGACAQRMPAVGRARPRQAAAPCRRFAIALLALLATAAADEAAPRPGVLVLYADNRLMPALVQIDETLRACVARAHGSESGFHSEFLDIARFPSPHHQERVAAFVRDKYHDRRIAVVVCVRDAALDFAVRTRASFAPAAPILYLAAERTWLDQRSLPADVIGLPMELDAQPNLALAQRLLPELTSIAVVDGDGDFDRQWIAEFQRALAGSPVPVHWLLGMPVHEVEQRVAALPAGSVVLLGAYTRDRSGAASGVPYEVARRISAASSAPVLVMMSSQVGGGCLGGAVIDVGDAARRTGDALTRLLAGARPEQLALRPVRSETVLVDWRQLRRWHIPEARLPAGARVMFREPTLWGRYRAWVLAAVAVIAAQALLISALLVNRHRLRRARDATAEAEQRMALAAASARLGAWVWNVGKGGLWLSDASRTLLGIRTGEAVSLAAIYRLIQAEQRAGVRAAFRRVRRSGVAGEIEFGVHVGDGASRWLAVTMQPQRADDGGIRRVLGIAMDVSERKRVHAQVERQRNELAHLARVASLNELSGSIAHELNQPLTAILSNAQAGLAFLAQDAPDLAEVRAILADIAQQDRRAGDVIRRMRAMLRKDQPHFARVDLREVAQEVLAMLRSELIARNVTCVTALGTAARMVVGDRVQLQQVLINLVANAYEAMAGVPPEQRRLSIEMSEVPGRVLCAVGDRGSGVPVAELQRIAEPFVSTKPHGLGMGLPICRTILAAHGGTLAIRNNPGGGATALLELPAA